MFPSARHRYALRAAGAPWIQPLELAGYLNARTITGVRFVPTNFTPSDAVYAQQKCGGVNIIVTDRNALDAPELASRSRPRCTLFTRSSSR